MEYMEIILKDIPIPFLKTILSEPLIFHQTDILSSHFFSSAVGRTCQYAEVKDWDAFLQGAGTSDMGYEPAEDPDMQILELRRGLFRTFCKNISHSPELQELCRVGNTYFCLSEDT